MDMSTITEETLDTFKKAQTSGILSTTGIYGVDLSGLVSLVPVVTPFRNQLARTPAPSGGSSAQWRALVDINNQQTVPSPGFDYAGPLVQVSELDVFAPYKPLAMAGRVTQDSMDLGKSYADVLAVETINCLNQLMIGEDKLLIGGQAYALATAGSPTVTASAATGGSIASGATTYVKVSAKAGWNYYYGGGGIASSAGNATSGTTSSTNVVSATWTAVPGAVGYDVFVSSDNTTYVYYTTVTVNAVTVTSVPTANQAVPTGLPNLYPTAPTAPPTADGTASSNQFNGLLATTVGDYGSAGPVQNGSGTSSGATITSLNGSALTIDGQVVSELDTLLLNIWNKVNLSPTALMMNAQQAKDISTGVLQSGSAQTFLTPADVGGRANISAGGYVGAYLNNAAGGQRVRVEVHPHVPPGTIIARTDTVPFPGANISNVFEVRTLRDYAQFNYGAHYNPNVSGGGPRTDFEVRSVETLVNRAPVCQGVLYNVGSGYQTAA